MSDDSYRKLEQAARDLREYGLTENTKAWLSLLEALTGHIKEDLLHADVGSFIGLQAQAKQLRALRDVVLSKTPANGRV